MRLLLAFSFALTALTLHPTVADASGCYRGPFAQVELPEGCPITVYQEASTSSGAPKVFATRDGINVDVTSTVAQEPSVWLDVGHPEYDCAGEIASITPYPTLYDVYTISVTDAVIGEDLVVGGWGMRVVSGGACVTLAKPEPLCGYVPDPCDDDITPPNDDDGGCNAGGGAGLGAALLALAGIRRRPSTARR